MSSAVSFPAFSAQHGAAISCVYYYGLARAGPD